MSLVATWCKCSDGKWYEEPSWRGEGWFLCLDDDDPPELVVKVEINVTTILPLIPWFHITNKGLTAGRFFKDLGYDSERANSYFGKFTKIPPPPQQFDSTEADRPDYMGCYYDIKE